MTDYLELHVINHKYWQRISLRVEFFAISEAKSSSVQISGVSPSSYRELLPLDNMTGKDARTKIIGRIVKGGTVLSTGNKNEELQLTGPGLYYYAVNLFGKFKGRKYSANGKVPIRITEKHEVKIEE